MVVAMRTATTTTTTTTTNVVATMATASTVIVAVNVFPHGRLRTRRRGPPRKTPGENPLKLPRWIVVYLPPLDEFERTKWVGSHP